MAFWVNVGLQVDKYRACSNEDKKEITLGP